MTLTVVAVVAPLPPETARGAERVEQASAHARLALAASAEISGCPLREFAADPAGVPVATQGWHWSLSHSHAHVAACVHRAPVGIDVEDRREARREVIERALSAQEIALLGLSREMDFLRAWTAKEAVLKELGLGLAGLSRCTIVDVQGEQELLVVCDGARRRVRQIIEADHVVSISVADDAELTWVTLGAPLSGGGGASDRRSASGGGGTP